MGNLSEDGERDHIRVFDPAIPIYARKASWPDQEDSELTFYLESALSDILSLSETPPICPHCNQENVVLSRRAAKPKPVLPVFQCVSCNVHLRRTTGTPLHGLRLHRAWFPKFLGLLSQQCSARNASELLGITDSTVARYIARFRQWLLELDPSGYYEAKVRLGMEIRPDVECPYCKGRDALRYRGFDSCTGERRCSCMACGRHMSLHAIFKNRGDDFVLEHVINVRPPSPRRKTTQITVVSADSAPETDAHCPPDVHQAS